MDENKKIIELNKILLVPKWISNVLSFAQKYPCLVTRNKILNELISGEFNRDKFKKALDISKTTGSATEMERRQKLFDEISIIIKDWGEVPPARIVCANSIAILIENGFDKQKTTVIGLPGDMWDEKTLYMDIGCDFQRGVYTLKNTCMGGYVEI